MTSSLGNAISTRRVVK
uniref:Uncharacterized protein n=1 Tax=Rhizophora mucronata TaxID=61149 RepID=A0A2P2IXB9_RHIMU